MTEAVNNGGAVAPAEPAGAPIDVDVATPNNPLGSQTPMPEKPAAQVDPEKPADSAREAVKRANEAIKAREPQKTDQPKAPDAKAKAEQPKVEEPKPVRDRATDGKFAAKVQDGGTELQAKEALAETQYREAPGRFDDAAKREWQGTPETVRGAVHRMQRELENGFQKYRADAESFNEVRDYAEMARTGGTTLKNALTNYVGLENELRRDPVNGLFAVCQNLGVNPLVMAQAMMERASQSGGRPQQPPIDPNALLAEAEARVENKMLERDAIAKIEQFKAQHPRFEELQDDIVMFLTNGRVATDLQPEQRLSEAYAMAERLNPAPAQPSIRAALNQPSAGPAQLKTAGQKSITGAPSSGSDPASTQAPSKSTREAIKRALRA